MTASVFRYQHRVTYADCTLGNHVYYARYLNLLEAARGEFFRHLGQPLAEWQAADTLLPVIECRLRYKAPARYDECLTVEIWIGELGRARLTFAYRVMNAAALELLEASTTHACTSLNDRIKRIPPDLAERLRPFLQAD